MKISIFDFKGIESLHDYKIENINVLTGANSGGKSTLIQFLLLLKQSIEAKSAASPLKLNHPYTSLGKFEQVLRKSSERKTFGFKLMLDSDNLDARLRRLKRVKKRMVAPDVKDDSVIEIRGVELEVSFKKATEKIVVDLFRLKVFAKSESFFELRRNSRGGKYTVTSNEPELFLNAISTRPETKEELALDLQAQAGFISFFPVYLETESSYFDTSYALDMIRLSVQRVINRITYIGPLREEPRDFYFQDDEFIEAIGNKGENAAYLLAKYADAKIAYKVYDEQPDGKVKARAVHGTMIEAMNYWMCDIFKLGKKIKVVRAKSNRYLHSVTLLNNHGQEIAITHVGFGVSQIFPVLVEGLRPARKRLIILEQPEIHLHPRVQSWLFDFVHSVADNVTFVIETHSDHFVNRLRRRIAEDDEMLLKDEINLTFVEPNATGVSYKRLRLSEIGSVDYWPAGFFDQYDEDVHALVRAQAARKRLAGKSNGK